MASSLFMVDKSPSVDDLHSLLSKVTFSVLFSWPSCEVEATLGMSKSYQSKHEVLEIISKFPTMNIKLLI